VGGGKATSQTHTIMYQPARERGMLMVIDMNTVNWTAFVGVHVKLEYGGNGGRVLAQRGSRNNGVEMGVHRSGDGVLK
jgi:hypothetical protein